MPKLFRTSNAALNARTFQNEQANGGAVMTLQGTVNKTGILLIFTVAAAVWTWQLVGNDSPAAAYPWMFGGIIGGLIIALITIYKKDVAPITAPIYAALEGLALGGLSSMLNLRYPGIAIHAVELTFGTLAAMLLAYSTGMIRATQRLRTGVIAATGAIALVYLIDIGLSFFGMRVPLINESGPLGILVSLVIVGVAALNLILDFDFVESGVEQGAAKYMEWYGAFGIMVTLVWLYVEMLRLMSKVRRR